MASETIVAVYDTPAHADLAIADLKAAGIPTGSIQHYTGEQYGYGSYDAARNTTGVSTASQPAGSQTYDPARDPAVRAPAATQPGETPSERSEGLWGWLFGEDRDRNPQAPYEENSTYGQHGAYDHQAYDHALRRGGTVVMVIAEQEHAQRIIAILEDHSPIDLEERGREAAGAAMTNAAAGQYAGGATGAARADGPTTEEVIPLSEESIQIGKREVDRGTTRVRRYVVERPVEEQVRLRDEKVSVFRRPATNASVGSDAFTDRTVDVRETAEEAVVGKTARVVEEVVVRKGVEERSETVRDTVRKEEVEITGPGGTAIDEGRRKSA